MENKERRHHRSQRKKQKKLIITCWVLATVLLVLVSVVVGNYVWKSYMVPEASTSTNGGNQSVAEIQKLEITSSVQDGDRMLVSTTYGTVYYSAAFSDMIYVEAGNHGNYTQLDFKVVINGETKPIYSLLFERNSGIPVGTLTVNGNRYMVTAVIHSPEGVGEADRLSFYAAQETFNDVMNSLAENSGFVPA